MFFLLIVCLCSCFVICQEQWQPARSEVEEKVIFRKDRGNWYLKKEYYKKATELYERIKKSVSTIEPIKNDFFSVRTKIDTDVDAFNKQLGFEEHEVDELLSELEKELTKERAADIELTEKERALLEQIREKKNAVEQVKADVQAIDKLQKLLDQGIGSVMETSGKIQDIEQAAVKEYAAIASEINDRHAERLFLSIQADEENIRNLILYLSNTLKSFFDAKVYELRNRMNMLKTKIDALKKQGVEISKKVREAIAQDLKRKQEEEKKVREREALGPLQKLWVSIKETLLSTYEWVTGFFKEEPQKNELTPKEKNLQAKR